MNGFRLCFLLLFATPVAAAPHFMHCYDYGCKTTVEVRYDSAQWQQIRQIFDHRVSNAQQEKQAIRRAIATMEQFSGAIAGTHVDVGGNYPGYDDYVKQMDCIDACGSLILQTNAIGAGIGVRIQMDGSASGAA